MNLRNKWRAMTCRHRIFYSLPYIPRLENGEGSILNYVPLFLMKFGTPLLYYCFRQRCVTHSAFGKEIMSKERLLPAAHSAVPFRQAMALFLRIAPPSVCRSVCTAASQLWDLVSFLLCWKFSLPLWVKRLHIRYVFYFFRRRLMWKEPYLFIQGKTILL